MSGSVYKRCGSCGRRVPQRTCAACGSTSVGWGYTLTVGQSPEGKRLRQSRSGFPSKKAAERALLEVQSSIAKGSFVTPTALTVESFLLEEWLPAVAPPRIGFETWEDRRRNLEAHVAPHLGKLRLQELNAAHINRLYAQLLERGRVDEEGGLSPTTVRRIHSILRKALNDAVRWGHLPLNPATAADPPSGKVVRSSMRRGMKTWSAEQLTSFLRATAGHQLHQLWAAAAATGMRRSEILGVRWSDVDLKARTLTVRQTIAQSSTGYVPVIDQKSVQSARTIHLDRRTVQGLEQHKHNLQTIRDDVADDWNSYDLVFPRADGRWWNPPAVSLAFRRAVGRTTVPRIRLHDLRHTHATLLLTAGVNPKVVSERLGHSSVAFTLDTYAHVMPGMQPEAAELFAQLVFEPLEATGEDR